MYRLAILLLLIISHLTSFADSREDIDQYNEETIELLDNLDSCLHRIDHAVTRAEDLGYLFGQAYALYLKGYVHRIQGDLGKAFLANLKGLELLQGIHDKRAFETQARLYLNTGEILEKHFKYDEAAKYYAEGLLIAKEAQLSNWVMKLTYNAGYAYSKKGDLPQAIEYIHSAYEMALEAGEEYMIVNSLNQMGLIFKENSRYDTAKMFFNKMLDFDYDRLNPDKYKGRAYHNLANVYAHSGDTLAAIATFYQSIDYKSKRNKPAELFITENDLVELLYFTKRHSEARKTLESCLSNYQHTQLNPDYYKVFDLARKIYASSGEYHMADHFAGRYVDENMKFINQQEQLIQIRDQFKMDVLTASFFSELERDRRISTLNSVVIWLLAISVVVVGYMRIKHIRFRSILESELIKLTGTSR